MDGHPGRRKTGRLEFWHSGLENKRHDSINCTNPGGLRHEMTDFCHWIGVSYEVRTAEIWAEIT